MTAFLVMVAAWLIGGIPFGFLLVRFRTGQDVRASGRGNIGATNVLRTSGRALGILTLVLDILKGAFAVWLADHFLHGNPHYMSVAAVIVMLGHAFPVFLRFRGGKAVASFIGAFLYLFPIPLLATLLVFVLTVAASRYISLASILAAALFPLAVWLIEHPPWYVMAAVLFAGAFIVWRHAGNIQRLRVGTENVFSFGGRSR